MKALGTSFSKLFAPCRGIEKGSVILCSRSVGFLGYKKQRVGGVALLTRCKYDDHSISLPSSSPQIVLENEETQMLLYSDHQINTVHVLFKLQRKCAFGQHFILVGDDPILGLWNPCDGVPLNWSDDHVWTVEMDVPSGKIIKYKFILMRGSEIISWQPGSDRVLEITNTRKTMVVSEDWDDPQLQIIVQEEAINEEEALIHSYFAVVSNIVIPEKGSDDIEEIMGSNGHASSFKHDQMVYENIETDEKLNELILGSEKNDDASENGVPVFVPELVSFSQEENTNSAGAGVEMEVESSSPVYPAVGVQKGNKKILEVDIEWGRKVLVKFLTNLWGF